MSDPTDTLKTDQLIDFDEPDNALTETMTKATTTTQDDAAEDADGVEEPQQDTPLEQDENSTEDFDWGDSALGQQNGDDYTLDLPKNNDGDDNGDNDNDVDNDDDFIFNGNQNNGGDDEFDDFEDFGDFDDNGNGDDFGDFDDLPPPEDFTVQPPVVETVSPVLGHYIELLEACESDLTSFMETTLSHLWTPLQEESTFVESPRQIEPTSKATTVTTSTDNELLCTECSLDLWQKLSRDSVFYNPITGSIGQFQWTRSEINRAYLNALGVRINYEDTSNSNRLSDMRPTSIASSPSLQSRPLHAVSSTTSTSLASSPYLTKSNGDRASSHMRSNSLTHGMTASATMALHNSSKPPVEEEPELDIDIAKAYCELTEETIRIFPDVKLNAMVIELSRLQRQAKEYLGYLLDQREQLMMDAETYNDLISCIVGHAQRLKEQNAAKDASPAMVSKKKKTTGGFSGMIKRKNTTSGSGTSMGGGVVGVKQKGASAKSINPAEGRRSM